MSACEATAKSTLGFAKARWLDIVSVILLIAVSGCTNELGDADPSNRASSKSAAIDETGLQKMIADTLQYNFENRLLSADRNAAWQVLHGVIAYGNDLPLQVGDQRRKAVEYLLSGGDLAGWDLYAGTDLANGRTGVRARLDAVENKGQGHVDQWLAILAQIDTPITTTVTVAGNQHTIADWIDQSLLDVPNNPLDEFSWTVISANCYRPDKQQWTAIDGTTIDIDTLVDFEAQQDINNSACGGSHRLMALARTVRYANTQGIAARPAFLKAKATLDKSMQTMRRYQNSDGSLSSNYFERPGASADLALMISATGHQIELAAYVVSDDELKSPWLQRAVVRWCQMLEAAKDQPLECGGLYHGLKGLRIYHDRRFGAWQPDE